MKNEIRFVLYAIKKNIQNSAELRSSFLMNIVGMAINNSAFILLWIFFVKSVGEIGGWTAADIVALQGFSAISFGLVFSVFAGIRRLPDAVSSGAFDRFMLSPKNLLLRVATSSFNPSAIGDIIFGIVCLIVYGFLIHIGWYQFILIIALIIIASIIFFAAAVTIFSMSFYFMDAYSVTSGFFDMFMTPALFDGGAFQGIMRFAFTFLIPSLLIGTLPVEITKDMSVSKLILIGVLAIFWFFFSIKIFNKAIKKYESSNFMTFGN